MFRVVVVHHDGASRFVRLGRTSENFDEKSLRVWRVDELFKAKG
jgi:hypothetical protein